MLIEITHQILKKTLNKGEISFKYEKKDGTFREAKGTTSFILIPEESLPKTKDDDKDKDKSICSYFDTEIKQWRSVSNDKKIYLETSSLQMIDDEFLEDSEINVILWDEKKLEDVKIKELIDFIMESINCKENVNNILEKNEKLIFACWNYKEDHKYNKELINKWKKFNNL